MNAEFWEEKQRHEQELNDEVLRVMEIMDDKGYNLCARIDYEYAHQFVKVETVHECRIISWIWAIPRREEFKSVLKWFCNETKFYGVTAYMAYDGENESVVAGRYRKIPTFYSEKDIDMYYDEYFGW